MKKILILYFSGVGATKRIAVLIHTRLAMYCNVDIFSIESKEPLNIDCYDAIVIGTPTYHAAPATILMDYLGAMSKFDKQVPSFIYNTHGLSSFNTNRILAKQLLRKNIVTIMDRAYRSPASDGSIIAPFVARFFEFEKELENKLDRDCEDFLELLIKDTPQGYIPRFQFSSIINALNKAVGQLITFKIHLHKGKCVKCGKCITRCPYEALGADTDGYPFFSSKNCKNCYRCIHHCSKMALSLSKRCAPKRLLRY